MIMYKIENEDGEYSTGGCDPSWTKKGKVWRTKSALHNHLLTVVDKRHYIKAKLITIEVTETEKSYVSVIKYIENIEKTKLEKERNKEERYQKNYKKRKEIEERNLYKTLKEKYEN